MCQKVAGLNDKDVHYYSYILPKKSQHLCHKGINHIKSVENAVQHLIFNLNVIVKEEKVKQFKDSCTLCIVFLERGYLLQSSVVFLMLCSTQNFCWSNIFSFCSKSSSSDFNSITLLFNVSVVFPGSEPLI